MEHLKLSNISNFILKKVSFSLKKGEFFVIIGPNGSGKTTLLNTIAGLIPYDGEISLSQKPIKNIQKKKPQIGYVFQKNTLFPNLTVYKNITFSLKGSQECIQKRVDELFQLIDLSHLKDRYPSTLSGGEIQKVALLRTLANAPEVILMDEPFSNLDIQITKHLRNILKEIAQKLQLTIIFITHNIKEAMELSDRIGVLIDGEMLQVDTQNNLFFHPCNDRVKQYLGEPNLFTVENQINDGHGFIQLQSGDLDIIIPADTTKPIKMVSILPENIYLSKYQVEGSRINHYTGVIQDIEYQHGALNITIKKGETVIHCQEHLTREITFKTGDIVYLIFPLKWIQWLTEEL